MGQMRFRDPKTDKVKYIADEAGNILVIGKDGNITGQITPTDEGETETVEIKPEDFGKGSTASLINLIRHLNNQ
jgi:hypothetical protein